MRKLPLFVLLTTLLVSCASPPRIAVTTQIRRTSATEGRLTVTIRNTEDRASTPILLEVSLRSRSAAPLRVIHPVAFVLNKREVREIIARFKSDAEDLEAVVELRAAQTGAQVKPISLQALPPTSPPQIPATAVPGTPPPPGK